MQIAFYKKFTALSGTVNPDCGKVSAQPRLTYRNAEKKRKGNHNSTPINEQYFYKPRLGSGPDSSAPWKPDRSFRLPANRS